MLFTQNSVASDYHSPRTAALGGAGHAGPLLTDAIYLNPALGSFSKGYSVSASLNTYSGRNDGEPRGRVVHASAQDGINPMFQAGAGYTRRADAAFVHVGASKEIVQKFGLGVGSKYGFKNTALGTVNEMTVGAAAIPLDWLQAALTIDNILEGQKSRSWNLYREVVLGTKINIQNILMLYLDPHWAPNKPGSSFGYELGAELTVMADLFFRLGTSRDSKQAHINRYGRSYSWGFGWIFPRLSLDFAMSRTLEPLYTKNVLFSATVSF